MTIKTKIILPFLLVSIFVIGLVAYSFYIFNSALLGQEISKNLERAATSRAQYIQTYLHEEQHKAEMLASGLSPSVSSLLDIQRDDPAYAQILQSINDVFSDTVNIHDYFHEIVFLNSGGIVLASTDNKKIGLNQSANDYFSDIRRGIATIHGPYYSGFADSGSIVFSMPLYDPETDQFLGVMAIRMDISSLNKILTDSGGLGRTGETYLIDKDYSMITPSRFSAYFSFNQKAETLNAKRCFDTSYNVSSQDYFGMSSGYHGYRTVDIFPDYRGILVLGTYVYIPETNWCLLAQIDETEALGPLKRVQWFMFLAALGIIFIFIITAYVLGASISRPIEALYKGVRRIEEGDFNYSVATQDKNEIGELSRVFDDLTFSLRQSLFNTKSQVEAQTKDLESKTEKLENQQAAILNVLREVKAEKQLTNEEKEKVDAILQSIGDGVFVVNKNSEIIVFNKIAAQISGFKKQEVLGKRYNTVLKFINQKTGEVSDAFLREAMETGQIKKMSDNTLLITKDGSRVPVADSAAPLKNKNGRVIGCVVVFRDVTAEREVDEMKNDFISMASHQLKTPLTTVKWYMEVLMREGDLDEKQLKFLTSSYAGAQRMAAVVNDLLNVSRLDSGRMNIEPKPVSLEYFLMDIISNFDSMIKERSGRIEFKRPAEKLPRIPIDSAIFSQVISNLITNAIAYTPKQKECVIVVGLKREGEACIISVKDNGIGIPEEVGDKVFDKFFRDKKARKQDTSGSGLGLYINKKIIEACGGKIYFKSEEDIGTTFYVSIPVQGMKTVKGEKGLA